MPATSGVTAMASPLIGRSGVSSWVHALSLKIVVRAIDRSVVKVADSVPSLRVASTSGMSARTSCH